MFARAIAVSAAGDYGSEQLRAWAHIAPEVDWAAARVAADTVVAVRGDAVIGFADLAGGALIDMLYVDPSHGRRGVGSALVRSRLTLARQRGAATVETLASLTARALFERHGFVVVQRRAPVLAGVAMTHFRMRLTL